MHLTSPHNPYLQTVREAAKAGRPTPDGLIVAEGPHLLEEVVGSAWTAEQILCTERARDRFGRLLSLPANVTEVSERAFGSLTTTESSQGILALLRPHPWTWEDITKGQALVVVLDAIQDPGNVGTIFRSAEAFGANGIILAPDCARVSNGKVLRAAAGSLFRLPYVEASGQGEILTHMRAAKLEVYALAPASGREISQCSLSQPCALVVGNEGSGLAVKSWEGVNLVSIPTARVESLNVAVALSVALFEAARQRKAS